MSAKDIRALPPSIVSHHLAIRADYDPAKGDRSENKNILMASTTLPISSE